MDYPVQLQLGTPAQDWTPVLNDCGIIERCSIDLPDFDFRQLDFRMERNHCWGRTLTVKVKYGNYEQVTRSLTVERPLREQEELVGIARNLLRETEVETRAVRLLGLTLSNLTEGDRLLLPHQLSIPFEGAV